MKSTSSLILCLLLLPWSALASENRGNELVAVKPFEPQNFLDEISYLPFERLTSGNCYLRALFVKMELAARYGIHSELVQLWSYSARVAPLDDGAQDLTILKTDGTKVPFSFHIAARISLGSQKMIIDPSVLDGIQPEEVWLDRSNSEKIGWELEVMPEQRSTRGEFRLSEDNLAKSCRRLYVDLGKNKQMDPKTIEARRAQLVERAQYFLLRMSESSAGSREMSEWMRQKCSQQLE